LWGLITPPALLLVLLLAACGAGDGELVSERVPGYVALERERADGSERVNNLGARERLRVRHRRPSGDTRLLFLDGRAATPTADGGTAWADLDGGRVILFDRTGGIARIIQAAGDDTPLEPVVVQATSYGVRIFERDGRWAAIDADGRIRRNPGAFPAPVTGATPNWLAATRSPLFAPLVPVRPGAPLVWLATSPSSPPRALGAARPSEEPVLGHLVNSGWALPAPDGGAYFASALRPELLRLDADGALRWLSSWPAPRPVMEPRIEAVGGSARANFEVLQHAMAMGDDGRIYLLVAPRNPSSADRLLVFEPDGLLLREGSVPPGHALFVDPRGAVYAAPPEQALVAPDGSARQAFPPFELPDLLGPGTVTLADHRGRVVVLNFWASWCPPCRTEIPVLDSLARGLDPRQAVVIGLNDDGDPARGIRFLEQLGGVSFPNAAGAGTLRQSYEYRGLPYTVILDRRHRVIRSFYGFGGSLDAVREVVLKEITMNSGEGGS
jgi:thiol-disulfide isomerase/thioredoxin